MTDSKRILVVEDEAAIRNGVLQFLQDEGYEARGQEDGRAALKHLEGEGYDLILLDGHLPGVDGFKVLETLRTRGIATPVLMLTARAGEGDRLLGFHLGADDYLVKPFYMSELGARIKVLLARAKGAPRKVHARLRSGPILFDAFRLLAVKDGEPLDLLPKEVKLLEVFLRNPGMTLTRDHLVKEAWERDSRPTPRTVDAHIARMRKKLGAGEDWLTTIPGEGYRWVIPVEAVEGEA